MPHKNPTIVPTEPPPPPKEQRLQEAFKEQVARRRARARDRRRTWLALGGAGALVLFLVILGLSALFRSESPVQETAPLVEQATLLITSTPSGAMVYLNDTERGATPFVSDTLTPGKRALSVRMASFVPFDSVLFLADTVSLDLSLEAAPVAADVTEEPPTPAPQTATREEEEEQEEPEPAVSEEPTSAAPEATPPPEEVADETSVQEVADETPVQEEEVADETPVQEDEQARPQTEEPVQPEASDAAASEEDETTNEDSPAAREEPAEEPPPQQEQEASDEQPPPQQEPPASLPNIVIEGQPATTRINIPKRTIRLGQGYPSRIVEVVGKRTLDVGEVENFRVKTTPESTPPTEFYWASEQGVFALGRSINLNFTKAGVYTIKVEAYNGYGTDNETLKITVKESTTNH